MSTNMELIEQYYDDINNKINQYNNRAVLKKEIRSYEVSLWTLQDDFLTVLKWSDVEQKGRIENPKMTLNVDGTQKLSFSIPMYVRVMDYVENEETGEIEYQQVYRENPSWYTVEQGNLIQGLRKIKVIFNKGQEQTKTVTTKRLNVSTSIYDYTPGGYNGNVDLSNRKIIPAQSFIDKGYNFTGDYGTLYSTTIVNEDTGDAYLFTPILLDGTVLTHAQLENYVNDLFVAGGEVKTVDATMNNLFLRKFTVSAYGSSQAAIDAAETWAENLHNLQERWDYVRYLNNWFNDNTIDPNHIYVDGPADFKQEIEEASVSTTTTTTGPIRDNVFEFVITNVSEGHEDDIKTCNVEAEGLAFQELGKIGYKINLSQENFELTYQQWQELGYWFDKTTIRDVEAAKHIKVSSLPSSNIKDGYLYLITESKNCYGAFMYIDNQWQRVGTANRYEPAQTLDYWCQEGCKLDQFTGDTEIGGVDSPRLWYYTVQLNQNSFEDNLGRSSGKIYEESYAVDWDSSMRPTKTMPYKEMARAVEIENSNLYNITQTLAETFHVFCRYKYLYDENYHIVGRIIIFYNNYMQEDKGNLELTYPYSASRTERTIDSADVTTKMYVLSVDNESILAGESSIMDSEANYSQEDYILNFDYLIETQGAPEDTESYVKDYLKQMRTKNKELTVLQNQLATYETQLPELEAKKTIYKNSLDLDDENILAKQQLHDAIASTNRNPNSGYFEKVGANCDSGLITIADDNSQFINLSNMNLGIVESTIKIHRTFATSKVNGETQVTFSGTINNFALVHDEYNNLTRINLLTPINVESSKLVYLEYSYDPQLYYQNIIKTWQAKRAKDEANYKDMVKKIGPKTVDEEGYDLSAYPSGTTVEDAYYQGLNYKIDNTTSQINTKIHEKEALIKDFERYMGPAVREGYWQPEDYDDHGERLEYTSIITSNNITADAKKEAIIAWDTLLFDDEDKVDYYIGAQQSLEFYPCIDLTKVYPRGIPTNLDSYSLVWKSSMIDGDSWSYMKNLTVFAVGSKALIKFVKYNDNYIPVLMLEGAKTFTTDQLERLIVSGGARLEKYSSSVSSNGTLTVTHGDPTTIPSNAWLCYTRYSSKPDSWNSNALWEVYNHGYNVNTAIKIAYPRIKFSSLMLKTDTSNLQIKYGDQLLELGADYYINTRNTLRGNVYYPEYYITIQPRSLIKYGYAQFKPITVYYALSNASTDIYLDALKISEENAKPKVSYNVSVNVIDTSLINQLYNQLARIVMINDTDLKFENVFGYISNLELDLDKPWEDQVEIKNYTTKFEDLFSSIVAQSEEMKRNEGMMSAMLAGTSPLTDEGLTATLSNQQVVMNAYLDSYFDSSQVVADRLTDLFTEASIVLSSSQQALNKVQSLTTKNAGILAGYARNIQEELTPNIVRSPERPQTFKVGDIWIKINTANPPEEIARYIAVSDSIHVTGNQTGHDGYVRTSDGTLASITGASLDVDSENGIISLKAQNSISLKSGHELYMAARDGITIISEGENDEGISIAGKSINLCSLYKRTVDPITGNLSISNNPNDLVAAGSINLIAGVYQDDGNYGSTSRILMNPYKIEIGAAELELISSSQMNFITSRGSTSSTSALHISADDGIWMGTGTNNGIHLFSGAVNVDNDGKLITSGQNVYDVTGASVEINSEHLILGFAHIRDNNTTAIELTDEHVIIAAGGSFNREPWAADTNYNAGDIRLYNKKYYKCISSHQSTSEWDNQYWKLLEIDGTTSGLVGARFSKDSIGFATQASNNSPVNAIIMNNKGITLGSGITGFTGNTTLATATTEQLRDLDPGQGSYVRVSGEGIEIGSFADVYLNTDNIKLQTHSRDKQHNQNFIEGETIFALGNSLQSIGYNSKYDPATGKFGDYNTITGEYSNLTNASVNLLVNKNGAYIKGDVYARAFIAQCTNGYFKAEGNQLGFYNTNSEAILTLSDSALTCAGQFRISADNLKLLLNNGSDETLSHRLDDIMNNEIIEVVRLYKRHNSGTNAPTISGTKDSNDWYSSADNTWSKTIPEVNSTQKYLWSVTRRTKANATYKYYYTDMECEGILGNDYKETYLEYTRAATTVAASADPAHVPNNYAWRAREIPYNTVMTEAANDGSYDTYSSEKTDVWCRVCTVSSRGTTYETAFKDSSLSEWSAQAIQALNIASGAITVPHVKTTGIEIKKDSSGNGVVEITATGSINLNANSHIQITNSAGNDALLLDKDGIIIATGQEISIAAGGSINMLSGGTVHIQASAQTDSNYEVTNVVTDMVYNLTTDLKMNGLGLIMQATETPRSGSGSIISSKFTLDKNALQYYTSSDPTLTVSATGLYLNINQSVAVTNGGGSKRDAQSIFHVKVEPDSNGLFYRTQSFTSINGIVHEYDTYTYISGDYFTVQNADTTLASSASNPCALSLLRITGDGLSFYVGNTILNTSEANWSDSITYDMQIPVATFRPDGCIVKELAVGQITIDNNYSTVKPRTIIDGINYYGLVDNIHATNVEPYTAYTVKNDAGARTFWFDIPENASYNPNAGTRIPAFWYKDGVVYIRELKYYHMAQDNSAFGESSGSSGSGGSSGGSTTVCGDCDGACYYGCLGSCDRDCTGRCVNSCLGTSTGHSGGCFVAGTQINLFNGSTIAIEKLRPGMKVISYNEELQEIEINTITSTTIYEHKNQIYDLVLSNNKVITLTNTHPVLTKEGWKAIDPIESMKEHNLWVTQLQKQDIVITINKELIYVVDIRYRSDLQDETVYICRTDPTHTFAVENVVVHNVKSYT